MPRAFLFHPPGLRVQRSEDRCQGDVDELAAASLRACNDLGYLAAVLRRDGFTPTVRDYPSEGGTWEAFEEDVRRLAPDVAIMGVTALTLLDDLRAYRIAKAVRPEMLTIAKGACLSACKVEALPAADLQVLDVGITGEAEWIVPEVVRARRAGGDLSAVRGIIYWRDGALVRTPDAPFCDDLDSLPFPARDLMPNHLYVRPDTGAPMATVQTGRGCPSRCIFCLSPIIGGRRLRTRSPANVVDEVEACVRDHGIRDFFFRADTFTMNRRFVVGVCRELLRRRLDVSWVANSRVRPLHESTLRWMKRAGCWLVALGIESGSDETLARMRKDATTADARRAVALCRSVGLKTLAYYVIGFPWEDRRLIEQTIRFGTSLNCDFAEVHVLSAYEPTPLWDMAREAGCLLHDSTLGTDYLTTPVVRTAHLSAADLTALRRRALRELYLNPRHLLTMAGAMRSPTEIRNYARYGWRLIRRLMATGRRG